MHFKNGLSRLDAIGISDADSKRLTPGRNAPTLLTHQLTSDRTFATLPFSVPNCLYTLLKSL
jgi:hypothetical protein